MEHKHICRDHPFTQKMPKRDSLKKKVNLHIIHPPFKNCRSMEPKITPIEDISTSPSTHSLQETVWLHLVCQPSPLHTHTLTPLQNLTSKVGVDPPRFVAYQT